MKKLRIRVERISDGEYVVREYGPRCHVDLFKGDIAECQNFAEDYVENLPAPKRRTA
jgi:hypothetical protein